MNVAVEAEEQKRSAKQIVISVLIKAGILLLLLIPTYIAIATYIVQKNAPVENDTPDFQSIVLTGPTGTEIHSLPTGDTLLSVFLPLMESATEVDGVPESHREGRYTAQLTGEAETETYAFYFLPGSPDCYITAPDGTSFIVTAHEKTTLFLNSSYAFELYEGAKLPTLTTAATDEVTPTGVTWHYRTANGYYTPLAQTGATNSAHVYPIANDVAFYFSTQPDSHEVVIRHGTTELYRGAADGISLTLADQTDFLDFEITAVFDQHESKDFYGTLTYSFRMEVVEAARFTPSALSVPSGGFFIIRCENVKNVDKLLLAITPTTATPVIFEKDDFAYVACAAVTAGPYRLQISYGTITATFDLVATPVESTHHTLAREELYSDLPALLQTHLPRLINEKGADLVDVTLSPHGTFLTYTDQRLLAFGDTLRVDGTDLSASPLPFDLYRIDGDVPALSAGRVLEVGVDEYVGKYVILDHGCGLYTWYAGLSELRVQKNDYVGIGQAVGISSAQSGRPVLVMATLGKSALSKDYLATHTFQWLEPAAE